MTPTPKVCGSHGGRAHLTCGGGSAAGSRQFAVTAETGAEDLAACWEASRMLAAEVAAAGKETVPAAVSRGGSGGAAGCWTAGRGMESGLMGRLGRLLGVRRLRGLELRWLRFRAAADTRLGMGGLGWWLLGVGWLLLLG